MRRLLSTGNHSCGASSRMAVNATRALNARSVSGTAADTGAATGSGRHQSRERSDVSTRIRQLLAAHPDRAVEDLDVVKSVFAEPSENFGIQIFELIFRRVPIERIEPA